MLHFPGFEPLDAARHRERYRRSVEKTATLWGFRAEVAGLESEGGGSRFAVRTSGEGWQTVTRLHVFDHDDIVARLNGRPLVKRLACGFLAAFRVVVEGAGFGYFRHAWRFGLFFAVPFVVVLLALVASLALSSYPLWLGLALWQIPLAVIAAYLLFCRVFIRWSDTYHVLHLFSDWEMAVAVARGDDASVNAWLDACAVAARNALEEEADEYLITSHSMGSSAAVHVIGMLLEREPELFAGKRVVFATLGGAVLQCALLRSARCLRARVGTIARARDIAWLDVQCLTDAVNFYRARVVALCGHEDAPQARIVFIRLKAMLTSERYRKVKRDLLRVHRQYVLDADRKTNFDFSLMTAGPLPASSFFGFAAGQSPESALEALKAPN
ncbi:hypothetical protein J2Z17_000939 [Rhizobium halophytocola]|uniref:Transmembrane protein n=1 Tax=Rhizobium halophytocola TaxID=735519 RepID=A0ABS4DV07_9HYPH|nr:hypothetical protein [Rhizobium halophytocola]